MEEPISENERNTIVAKSKGIADKLIKNQSFTSNEERILAAASFYEAFMRTLGLDTDSDPNCIETAYRVSKMFVNEKCKSLYTLPPKLTVFPNSTPAGVKKYDEYVVVKDLPYFSVCSHHHVTFYGKAHIAYHPKDNLVGLSKFGRVVEYFAAKPQIQEEMTHEIIDYLHKALDPVGIMVVIDGQHLCMSSRGVRAVGSVTVTSAIRGDIDKKECLSLFK